MTDEKMIQSKKEIAERFENMAPKPLEGPEEKSMCLVQLRL